MRRGLPVGTVDTRERAMRRNARTENVGHWRRGILMRACDEAGVPPTAHALPTGRVIRRSRRLHLFVAAGMRQTRQLLRTTRASARIRSGAPGRQCSPRARGPTAKTKTRGRLAAAARDELLGARRVRWTPRQHPATRQTSQGKRKRSRRCRLRSCRTADARPCVRANGLLPAETPAQAQPARAAWESAALAEAAFAPDAAAAQQRGIGRGALEASRWRNTGCRC